MAHTGAAAGDVFTNIEIVEGSNLDDTFVGNSGDNNFVGGDGADSFNGNGGTDSVWYLGIQSGIVLDLATGALSDGDALGDAFTSIKRFTGSPFNDT
jgi:Ca2+-binding RTX toxin-like protein